jgi:hypothetical protein
MPLSLVLFAFLVLTPAFGQSRLSYGEQRAFEDSRPETMAARSRFNQHTTALFNRDRAALGLNHVSLRLDSRMVAQRARGADSAMAIIPRELNQILSFIHQARTNRAAMLHRLTTLPSLRSFDRQDLARALAHVANTRSISMNYWGYLGRTERLPQLNLSTGELKYFARWIEAEDRYQLVRQEYMWSLVIRGIIEQMNYRPWYSCVLGC